MVGLPRSRLGTPEIPTRILQLPLGAREALTRTCVGAGTSGSGPRVFLCPRTLRGALPARSGGISEAQPDRLALLHQPSLLHVGRGVGIERRGVERLRDVVERRLAASGAMLAKHRASIAGERLHELPLAPGELEHVAFAAFDQPPLCLAQLLSHIEQLREPAALPSRELVHRPRCGGRLPEALYTVGIIALAIGAEALRERVAGGRDLAQRQAVKAVYLALGRAFLGSGHEIIVYVFRNWCAGAKRAYNLSVRPCFAGTTIRLEAPGLVPGASSSGTV